MIVKIQKALFTREPIVLIYNEDRSVFQEMDGEVARGLIRRLGKRKKGYFKATSDGSTLDIGAMVKDGWDE